MGARKKSESKDGTFTIPKEHRTRLVKLSKEEDLVSIRMHINKAKYEAAIRAGDEEAAYDARFVQEPKLHEAGHQAHKELWDAVKEAVPAANVDGEGCWNYNAKEHKLEPHDHSDEGPTNMMGMLQRSLGAQRN